LLGTDRDRRKRFPPQDPFKKGLDVKEYGLANVGLDEQRDATAETVAFLKELVKKNDNYAGESWARIRKPLRGHMSFTGPYMPKRR